MELSHTDDTENPLEIKEEAKDVNYWENLGSAKIGNLIDEKDKEISQAIANVETLHQSIINLRRQRLDLESGQSKAKFVVEKLKIERSLLRSYFWHCKNQGL